MKIEKAYECYSKFSDDVLKNIELMAKDRDFLGLSNIWNRIGIQYKYAHNFTWLGRPIIQVPQDIYAMQELIWKVKPDLIIETGIAHGGSLIMSASMLALLDYCEAIEHGEALKILNPLYYGRKVIGIDVEIRQHNREAIEAHPLFHIIEIIEGSSISREVINKVLEIFKYYKGKKVMLFLDSNHAHEHVLSELKAYAPLVSIGSYCVVWDTGIEDLPEYMEGNTGNNENKKWRKGNNPKTAVFEFLKSDIGKCFEIDKNIEKKLMITSATDGFLKRVE